MCVYVCVCTYVSVGGREEERTRATDTIKECVATKRERKYEVRANESETHNAALASPRSCVYTRERKTEKRNIEVDGLDERRDDK